MKLIALGIAMVVGFALPAYSDLRLIIAHGEGGGGQVLESGPYHLELITLNQSEGIHLDFYLQQGDSHQPISDADVTAQIQFPDGSQQALKLEYDAAGAHLVV